MTRIAHHPAAQRIGYRCGRIARYCVGRVLDRLLPVAANTPLDQVREVRRVLLVRPNFRIGNTLIASPLVLALRRRFPGARLDYLSGDTTASLLEHLPVDAVHSVSRRFILRPWQFVALFVRLRRMHYDVAVEAGMGSFSGGLYTLLTGARYRIGVSGRANRFLNVRLAHPKTAHVYDSAVAFARLLGADCPDHPVYAISAEESARAAVILRDIGLMRDGAVQPFVGLFVGGHQSKRWPAPRWLDMARALGAAGARAVIFAGPEEGQGADRMRRDFGAAAVVVPPQPLRTFAALWSRAALVVTPDSGPMHLAAAFGVPTIAILQSEDSLKYRSRNPLDVVLMRAGIDEVVAAVTHHPRWDAVRVAGADSGRSEGRLVATR